MKLFFRIKKIFQTITGYLKKVPLKHDHNFLEEIKRTGRYI
jgi:hypothetical protein